MTKRVIIKPFGKMLEIVTVKKEKKFRLSSSSFNNSASHALITEIFGVLISLNMLDLIAQQNIASILLTLWLLMIVYAELLPWQSTSLFFISILIVITIYK